MTASRIWKEPPMIKSLLRVTLLRFSLLHCTLISLALSALAPAAALAQQQQVNIFFPFDNASCATWGKYAGNRAIRQQYEFWILGFVSGHNYANPARQVPTGKLPVSDQLYAYLDEYCHDNPNSSVVGGAFRLIEQFRENIAAQKPQSSPPPAKKEATKDAAKSPPPAAVK
jgi:hypothetical protein